MDEEVIEHEQLWARPALPTIVRLAEQDQVYVRDLGSELGCADHHRPGAFVDTVLGTVAVNEGQF